MTKTALIIVDVQNDFVEGGSLAVEGGLGVADRISDLLASDHGYDLIVATYDWHQPHGPEHFAQDGADPDYNETWPSHCVADTNGAQNPEVLWQTLGIVDELNTGPALEEVYKGQDTAAFSGFDGHTRRDGTGLSLKGLLNQYDIEQVDVCGLALDYCVKATATDAVRQDFDVKLLLDLTAAVNPDNTDDVLDELARIGVEIA